MNDYERLVKYLLENKDDWSQVYVFGISGSGKSYLVQNLVSDLKVPSLCLGGGIRGFFPQGFKYDDCDPDAPDYFDNMINGLVVHNMVNNHARIVDGYPRNQNQIECLIDATVKNPSMPKPVAVWVNTKVNTCLDRINKTRDDDDLSIKRCTQDNWYKYARIAYCLQRWLTLYEVKSDA